MKQGIKQLEPNHWLIEPDDVLDAVFFTNMLQYPKVVLLVPFNLNEGWKDVLITAGYQHTGQYQLTIDSVSTVCAKWQTGRINDNKAFLIDDGWNERNP
jgi:hypothetical protein